jgi:type II secretory ATPase GspE/PulE/Tfp pilus assembly ATPase PilB-like protein
MVNQPQDVSSWFETIMHNAIDKRASDVHFEPERDTLNVRFRIDGLLQQAEVLGNHLQDNIISMIKVMSNMNITERRLPQDGHFEFNYTNKVYNIRVSVLPSMYGETIVFRILNREDILIRLEGLGLLPDQLVLVNKLIASASGMVLTTGPTGSGKTNLLYSIIHALNKPNKNIITLEDPIEYQMANIRQTQINESIGLNYVKAMRSVVRQDPDVVMLGEIRDVDTAQMAILATLTGILIFTTFHTFDVPALITRFLEFGITNSIIAQTIKGVISTRLVRKICDSCKEPYEIKEFDKLDAYTRNLIEHHTTPSNFQRGRGCDKCGNTGYLGRTGVFEVVYFDEEIKTCIIEYKLPSYISALIQRKKQRSLRDAAMEKVFQGVTTIEEVNRVLGSQIG